MSARFTQQSSFETVGDSADPDVLYYNASIVNNNTDDTPNTSVVYDPVIRFNETRDTAILKDASRYQFSIVRFTMNGADKDLPLFIPNIQSSTGQTDVNLTEYGFGITWEGLNGSTQLNLAPPLTYVEYVPETQNSTLAPPPRSMANKNYAGTWSSATTYVPGQIVYASNDLYYQATLFPTWLSNTLYSVGSIVGFANSIYVCVVANSGQNPTASASSFWTVAPNLNQDPASGTPYWTISSSELGQSQDITSRYYWIYTYSHWVDLCNVAIDNANQAVYALYFAQDPATYKTYADWTAVFPSPILKYNQDQTFSIYYPACYASPLPTSNAYMTLYFNTNTQGLFTNFNNIYLNQSTHPAPYTWITSASTPVLYPVGYANLMLVSTIGLGDNVVLAKNVNVQPSGYTGNWWIMTQNYTSTSTLWSPIDSIVFTSTLLPLQNEQTAPPNSLGTRNTGISAGTSQSAFSPIITDIALNLDPDGAGYRKMIYYAPTAEYRMADFQNSKADIRSIDIQVFWKNRLDNQLYPVSMFNFSSVSFKLMFRKK
jgi:hypothetical protein